MNKSDRTLGGGTESDYTQGFTPYQLWILYLCAQSTGINLWIVETKSRVSREEYQQRTGEILEIVE